MALGALVGDGGILLAVAEGETPAVGVGEGTGRMGVAEGNGLALGGGAAAVRGGIAVGGTIGVVVTVLAMSAGLVGALRALPIAPSSETAGMPPCPIAAGLADPASPGPPAPVWVARADLPAARARSRLASAPL